MGKKSFGTMGWQKNLSPSCIGSGYFEVNTSRMRPFLAKFWPQGFKAEINTPAAAPTAAESYILRKF